VGAKNAHQTALKKNLCRIYQCNEKHGDAFLSRIITGDEAQAQPYNPLTKNNQWTGAIRYHHTRKKIQGADFCG
jgi:hypothetical protein